jgi:hypothetical protein
MYAECGHLGVGVTEARGCARFVTNSDTFQIILEHSSAQGRCGPVLPQSTLTRTYTNCGLGLKILVSAVQSRPSPPFLSSNCLS